MGLVRRAARTASPSRLLTFRRPAISHAPCLLVDEYKQTSKSVTRYVALRVQGGETFSWAGGGTTCATCGDGRRPMKGVNGIFDSGRTPIEPSKRRPPIGRFAPCPASSAS